MMRPVSSEFRQIFEVRPFYNLFQSRLSSVLQTISFGFLLGERKSVHSNLCSSASLLGVPG